MDGEVTEIGRRSRNHLSLVRGGMTPARRSEALSARPSSGSRGATSPVLYINGDCENRIILTRLTRRWRSARLIVVDGGHAGLRTLVGHRPRLVLLDAHLPDCHSLDVMIRIGEMVPLVPVVVLSNSPDTQEEARFVRAGASAYITKPLDVAQFDATVMMLLETRAFR